MEIILIGLIGRRARQRVATVHELVHEDARTLNHRQVVKVVQSLVMMSKVILALKDLALVSKTDY